MVINISLEDLNQEVFDEFMKLDLEFDLQCDGTTVIDRYVDINVTDGEHGINLAVQVQTWLNKRILDEKGIKYGCK